MSTIADRISSLSPEKRQLFERIVQEKRLKSNGDTSVVRHIPRREPGSSIPLSFAQQRLWIMDQLQPDKPLYNEHGQLRFRGHVDLVVLEQCINEVVRRHEILRLRILANEGKPAPEIMEPWHARLEIIDLREQDSGNQEEKVRELATREARQVFDLHKGPLFQIKVLDLADTEKLLLVTLHHLISDGWSMGLFANEIAALYTAALEARPLALPPLSIQYPDYALWQRKLWEEEKWQQQLRYWKQQLHNAVPYLDLPADARYSDVQNFDGRLLRRELPEALSDSIRSLSAACSVTPFVVLLAAFKLLLWRSNPQQEINVSVPVSGRNHLDLEPLIGMFINVVVLRTAFEGSPSFLEFMQRVHATSVAAFRNQEVSFDKLVEELQPERKLHRNPFSDVLFNFLNFPSKPFQLPGLQISREDLHDPIARFPVTVYIDDQPRGFVVRFLYQTELFSAGQIGFWMEQFEHLLEQIVTGPSGQLEDFTLVTPEARRILPDPGRELLLVPQTTVIEKISAQAATHPELCAVQQHGASHSYGEFIQRASEIGKALLASGLKPNDVVAVTGNRSFGLITAMLGAFMARGVLLMLDSRLPLGRRLLMMRESHARALVCAGTEPIAQAADLICIQISESNAGLLTSVTTEHVKLRQVSAEDPAYIFFTSGTTGVPKAILGWHMGLGHFLAWQQETFSIDRTDRFAQLTGLSFDVVLRDIFLPLASGAALLLPEDIEDLAFDKIIPWLKQERITGIHTTPSIAHSWLAHAKEQYPLPDLKYVFFAGEPLTDTLVRQWRKTFPGPVELINLYGPTETTLAKCYYRVPSSEKLRAATQPVGYPLPQTQVLIMRSGNRMCGIGELGEIVVRTPFRSLGYANAPEEQGARFVPNPWRNDPTDLLYHTGDLGRYRPDGAIEIAGRLDDQIKIRGIRIQPEEITATLSRHSSVKTCFVAAVKSSEGENTLIAYVVTNDAMENAQELRTYLSNELPGSMVPSAFVFLEKLPLTANGKIDRKALPIPALIVESETKKTAPRTPLEAELAEIWRKALNVKEVGTDDNFFELGGHSLLAIELMYQTRTHFGIDLPLAALFQQPTVAGLATVLEHRLATGGRTVVQAHRLPAIVPDADHHEPFPLTDIQQAYWVGRNNDLELGNVATHNYSEFEFLDLDITRLRNAFQRLIERHGMLRAVVRSDGFQQILPEAPRYEIAFHDLRGDEQQREKALEEIRWRLSHQILPLDNWPLFEFLVTRWDEHVFRLHISVDALICDAWSRRILGRELLLLYREPGKKLPPLELSFRDYVIAERTFRETEAYRKAEEYWDNRLPTLAPSPQVPLARNLAEHVKPRFIRFRGEIDAENWKRIKRLARQAGLTSSALVCAAYAEVLAAWSASLHFTINLTLFQRMPVHPQVNDVVGDFTSLILLEVNHRGECFEKRARQIQEQLWRDLDNSSYSGVKVLRKLHHREGGMARALMPIVLTSTLVDEFHSNHELISAWRRELKTAISQTPQVYLDHQVSEEDGCLYFNWDVVKEAFPETVIEEMFAAYCSLLRRLGESQQAWLEPSHVEGLLPARQQQIRKQVNATVAPQQPGLIQDAFFSQAEKRGPAIAVVEGSRQLSYQELAEYASGYGEQLRSLGAQPNRLIAIVMEKGWEQVVAALAIVESGSAYLPIDAHWPVERRRQLLEIGQVEVALTQSQWAGDEQGWPEGVKVLVVEEAGPRRRQRLERSSAREQDLAYVIFTSGSTGVPKGVMMEHGAVWNTVADINQRLAVKPEDAVLGISSLSFDLSVYDIFGVLGAGGKLVLPGAEEGRDPGRWLEQMREEKVSLWNSVPALMEMLVEYVEGGGERLPESLRVVMMSGDWIGVSLPGRMRKLADQELRILSLGGATEAAIWSIFYSIEQVEEGWKSIPYGKPLTNQKFYVLKENGEMSPEWVPGQLYIGGAGLARGYWRDEEKTRERFRWHAGLGERLYWTGDLGRYLPEGEIEFLGREDAQVKIQGFRIELGEIESALRKHAGVKEALVTVVGNTGPGAKRLAAYVVPHKIDAPSSSVAESANAQVLKGFEEREEFRQKRLNLRPMQDKDVVIRLSSCSPLEQLAKSYRRQRPQKVFRREPVSFEHFSEFFQSLRQLDANGQPRYQYASVGEIYPVQVYIHVKPGRVENVPAGAYYYYPLTHELVDLCSDETGMNYHWPMNQEIFQNSAFSIFLVAEMASITPLFGEASRDFCMVEAGMIMQLLEIAGAKCHIGMYQIGSLDFSQLHAMFQLKDSQILLYSAVSGATAPFAEEMKFEYPGYHSLPGISDMNSHLVATVNEAELREHLQRLLPAPLIPAHWIMLDALPLSANGKVDRKALPPPEDLSSFPTSFAAPGTELEQQIASAIAEELKINRVGLEENFFDLGATSINLVRVNARLGKQRLAFSVVELFRYPTVAALSRRLANSKQEAEVHRSEEQERSRKQRKARARHVQTS